MHSNTLVSLRRLIAASTLALGSMLALTLPATAAPADSPSVTWSMSPAAESGADGRHWVELELEPGQQQTEHLVVKNHSEHSASFALQTADGYFTDTGRFNMLTADQASVKSGTWIQVQDEITVEAGQSQIVPFTVTVPHNATPGDHAAGIASVISNTGRSTDGASVALDSRVGFRVMTRVEGPLQPALGTDNPQGSYTQNWNPFAPGSIEVNYGLSNKGNLQLEPTSLMTGPLAKESTAGEIASLLPGDSTRVSARIETAWPLFLTPVELSISGTDASGTQQVTTAERIWIWTLPLPQLLVALGIALCVVGVRHRKDQQGQRLAQLLEQARHEGASSVNQATGTTKESV